MRRITLKDRFRYRFDNIMARGTPALVALLFATSGALVIVVSIVVAVTGTSPKSEDGSQAGFASLLWMSLLRALDSGTMASDTGSPIFVGAMLGVTLGGIFVVSSLIGIINNGIGAKVEQLRKGRSFVCETGHTLVLGWAPQIFTVLREIALANASRGKGCIVVLADQDKVEMEDRIRDKHLPLGNTRVVCRSGSPIDPRDLEIGNPGGARSILVLAPEEEQPDAHVIKTLLALMHESTEEREHYHIVAEIHDPHNEEPAALVGKRRVRLVLVEELISRVTAQTCRQSGLSAVYMELLSFDGNDIYLSRPPGLAKKTFGDALFALAEASPIGIRRDGETLLNPKMDTEILAGDELIVIALDERAATRVGPARATVDEDAIASSPHSTRLRERTLVLGWSKRCTMVINELAKYVPKGSLVTVAADTDGIGELLRTRCAISGLEIEHKVCDTTDRRALDSLDVPSYHHVITVSCSDTESANEADAHTIVTLLHLRDIKEKSGAKFSITSEMLDVRNRELAEVTEADDFIVSHALGSLVLAQVSESPAVGDVLDHLFAADGEEIYLRPVTDYVVLGKPIGYETLIESGRRRGEVVIGYRSKIAGASPRYGVVLNPKKTEKIAFEDGDRVIVVAPS